MTASYTYTNFKIYLDNTIKVGNTDIIKKSNARYVYKLKTPIILQPHDIHSIQIGVESLSIPLTFDVVNETNDTLYLDGESIILQNGNYNVATFLTELNTKFALSTLYTDVLVAFNPIISKLVFTSSSNERSTLNFTDTPQDTNSSRHLIGSTSGIKTLPYNAENGINLTYTTGITVRVNNLTTVNQDLSQTGSGTTSLLRVPINTSPNTVLSLLNNDPFMSTVRDKVITHLDVGLFDDKQEELLLKNNAYFITLRIIFIKTEGYILDRTTLQKWKDTTTPTYLTNDEDNTMSNPLKKK